jgi:hypothetical protein
MTIQSNLYSDRNISNDMQSYGVTLENFLLRDLKTGKMMERKKTKETGKLRKEEIM